jgi:hypothetical protein
LLLISSQIDESVQVLDAPCCSGLNSEINKDQVLIAGIGELMILVRFDSDA